MSYFDFDKVLDTYRDIEVAKRAQPAVVQSVEQTQTPFPQNVQAPVTPLPADTGRTTITVAGVTANKTMLYVTGGALALIAVYALVSR